MISSMEITHFRNQMLEQAVRCKAAAGIPASKNLLQNEKAVIEAMKWGGAVLRVRADTPTHRYWRVPHAAPIQVRDGRVRLRVSKDGLDVGTTY